MRDREARGVASMFDCMSGEVRGLDGGLESNEGL